ncbi:MULTISPECIES: aKG-HExxH-type peptide beta-hydroxylase [Ralstonia solanacearum species complex]|uniref:aKG-HExxH-type peptide beta-hydroxylase n=1 Tax=Ralstonia solanacearum species complex TaxID=3116862 RepID=UPI001F09A17F|nr:HEXXH motif-containing putative peptide modification protein [Ralstonia solanacearum]BEU74991.1 hypothetical protein MAFF211271_45460 [Ralstonia pseudosolanacearum]
MTNGSNALLWTRQFSLPDAQSNERIFDTVMNAHGMAVAKWLLDLHGDTIAAATEGLLDYLHAWIADPGPSDTAWDIAFGRVHLAMKEGHLPDPVGAAVRLGLRIARSGRRGRWSAPMMASPVQFDEMLVEHVRDVEVNNAPGAAARVTLGLADGTSRMLDRNVHDGRWQGEGAERLESVGRHRAIQLLHRRALPPEDCRGDIFKECQPVTHITREAAQSFHDGFEVLERNAPQYVPWIERVLKGIVVCPQQETYRLVSGSWEDVPGFAHMSSPHGGIDIAEVLVHECAHQYFYMLQRVGPVDDASDAQLYWSPPIRKKRPLSRILMAYHALANVQLLYDAVANNPANSSLSIQYVKVNEPALQAAIQALEEPLRGNSALTELGRGLYEPLAERMAMLEV